MYHDEFGNDVSLNQFRDFDNFGNMLTILSVAIVAAIRVSWKDEGNGRDQWYICKPSNPILMESHMNR